MTDSFYSRITDPIVAVEKLGEWFALSGMFGCKKKEQGCVLAMACLIEQRNPMDYLRTYHLNDGKLTMRADAMLAGYMKLGGEVVWESAIDDCKEAKAKWTFRANKNLQTNYTISDAAREGSAAKDTYKKSTPDMLRARLISKTIRMIAPEVVAGCYTPEELGGDSLETTTRALMDSISPEPAASKKAEPESKPLSIEREYKEDGKELEKMGLVPPLKSVTSVETGSASTQSSSPESNFSASEKPSNFDEVEKLLKENNVTEKANAWLRKNKWIKEGQTYDALNQGQCANILRRPANFIKAIQG